MFSIQDNTVVHYCQESPFCLQKAAMLKMRIATLLLMYHDFYKRYTVVQISCQTMVTKKFN